MTSPTEQEIVARAIEELFLERSGYSIAEITKAAIHALDQYRAKTAGEVEQALDNLANHLFSLDSGSGEGKLLVQAANLISSLRSAIAEKDEALLDAKNVLISGCRMPLGSRIIGVIDASLSDGAK